MGHYGAITILRALAAGANSEYVFWGSYSKRPVSQSPACLRQNKYFVLAVKLETTFENAPSGPMYSLDLCKDWWMRSSDKIRDPTINLGPK
jgi:hypothetical protein